MCFSASASFGVGALLTATGIVTMKKTESPRMQAFAGIPLIFGAQQLSEGLLWLAFMDPEMASWQDTGMYLFLFLAQVIWPLWLPLAVWLIEPDARRKKIMSYFLWIGGGLSVWMLYCLLTYEVSAVVESRHIRYYLHFPNMDLRRVLYFLATVIPLFLSSLKWMKLIAVTLLGALILSFIFFTYYVISVWCFFAAILSIQVLLVVLYNRKVSLQKPASITADHL